MASCRQATGHYLNQCWRIIASPYDVTEPNRSEIYIYIAFAVHVHIMQNKFQANYYSIYSGPFCSLAHAGQVRIETPRQ